VEKKARFSKSKEKKRTLKNKFSGCFVSDDGNRFADGAERIAVRQAIGAWGRRDVQC
jgi:hypothetical protein